MTKCLGQQKDLQKPCILSGEKQRKKDLQMLMRRIIKDAMCLGLQSRWS